MFRRTALVATLSAAMLMSTALAASAQEPTPVEPTTVEQNPVNTVGQTLAGAGRTLVSSVVHTVTGTIGSAGVG